MRDCLDILGTTQRCKQGDVHVLEFRANIHATVSKQGDTNPIFRMISLVKFECDDQICGASMQARG